MSSATNGHAPGRRAWTTRELAYVREHYLTQTAAEIAKRLGRSIGSVHEFARRHGLRGLASASIDSVAEIRARCRIDVAEGEDACWMWLGPMGNNVPHGRHAGRLRSVRQVMFELFYGRAVRPRMNLRPTCGCSACLNPAHLKEVPSIQSARNRHVPAALVAQKPRQRAIQRGIAKLDAAKAAEIRQSAQPARELAQRYGVTPQAIYYVRRGESWAVPHLLSGSRDG